MVSVSVVYSSLLLSRIPPCGFVSSFTCWSLFGLVPISFWQLQIQLQWAFVFVRTGRSLWLALPSLPRWRVCVVSRFSLQLPKTHDVECLFLDFFSTCIFFDEVSVYLLPDFKSSDSFLLLSFKCPRYILGNRPSSDVSLASISSRSAACPLILLSTDGFWHTRWRMDFSRRASSESGQMMNGPVNGPFQGVTRQVT